MEKSYKVQAFNKWLKKWQDVAIWAADDRVGLAWFLDDCVWYARRLWEVDKQAYRIVVA